MAHASPPSPGELLLPWKGRASSIPLGWLQDIEQPPTFLVPVLLHSALPPADCSTPWPRDCCRWLEMALSRASQVSGFPILLNPSLFPRSITNGRSDGTPADVNDK